VLDLATAVAPDTSQSGVVACALYRDGQRICDIAVEDIGALAGREGGIVWLGLHEPEAALLGAIQSQLGLHDLMIEDANQPHQRAKLDVYDNILFIVLRTAQLDSQGIPSNTAKPIWSSARASSCQSGMARRPPTPK
jgi:magnesium transporter